MDLRLIRSKQKINSTVCRYLHWQFLPQNIKIPTATQYPLQCVKRKNHHDILIQLLEEIKDLQLPTLRYWGGEENQVYPTMVFLEIISNDSPERCSNTCTTLNGTFTHRWRHSCLFDDNTVPCYQFCNLKNIEFIRVIVPIISHYTNRDQYTPYQQSREGANGFRWDGWKTNRIWWKQTY